MILSKSALLHGSSMGGVYYKYRITPAHWETEDGKSDRYGFEGASGKAELIECTDDAEPKRNLTSLFVAVGFISGFTVAFDGKLAIESTSLGEYVGDEWLVEVNGMKLLLSDLFLFKQHTEDPNNTVVIEEPYFTFMGFFTKLEPLEVKLTYMYPLPHE